MWSKDPGEIERIIRVTKLLMIEEKIIFDTIIATAWIVPVITGLVQVIKGGNWIVEKYLPLVSIAVGIALSLVVVGSSMLGVLVGLMFGLAASGFYDLGKKTIAGR